MSATRYTVSKNKRDLVPMSIRWDPAAYERLKAESEQTGTSIGAIVNSIVLAHFGLPPAGWVNEPAAAVPVEAPTSSGSSMQEAIERLGG